MIDLNVVWNAYMAGYFDYCGTMSEAARRVERLFELPEFSVKPRDDSWEDFPHFYYEGKVYNLYRFMFKGKKRRPVPSAGWML